MWSGKEEGGSLQTNSAKDRQDALAMIDLYLAGEITADDLARWGNMRMSEQQASEAPSLVDYALSDALGTMMMLSASEPVEYRSTRADVLMARSYLLGEKPFPPERVPRRAPPTPSY